MNHDIEFVIPGWSDPKRQPAILKQLADYAVSMGFKPAEINNMRDRRLLLLTYKAMMFDHSVKSSIRGR